MPHLYTKIKKSNMPNSFHMMNELTCVMKDNWVNKLKFFYMIKVFKIYIGLKFKMGGYLLLEIQTILGFSASFRFK